MSENNYGLVHSSNNGNIQSQLSPINQQQSQTVKTGNMIPGFVLKLWKMLNDTSCVNLISWTDDGRSFIVIDSARFSHTLSRYFKHNNLSSFIRQLNMYGFRKVSSVDNCHTVSDDLHFYHPNFVRSQPQQLELIKRKLPQKSCEPLDYSSIIKDIETIEHKQTSFNSSLSDLKHQNEMLWVELRDLRERHQQQQLFIGNLMKFVLDSLKQQSSIKSGSNSNHHHMLSLKRKNQPLMIGSSSDSSNDGSSDSSPNAKRTKSSNKSQDQFNNDLNNDKESIFDRCTSVEAIKEASTHILQHKCDQSSEATSLSYGEQQLSHVKQRAANQIQLIDTCDPVVVCSTTNDVDVTNGGIVVSPASVSHHSTPISSPISSGGLNDSCESPVTMGASTVIAGCMHNNTHQNCIAANHQQPSSPLITASGIVDATIHMPSHMHPLIKSDIDSHPIGESMIDHNGYVNGGMHNSNPSHIESSSDINYQASYHSMGPSSNHIDSHKQVTTEANILEVPIVRGETLSREILHGELDQIENHIDLLHNNMMDGADYSNLDFAMDELLDDLERDHVNTR